MKYVMLIIAMSVVLTLMSGRITINFQHNLHLPPELTNKTTIVNNSSIFKKGQIYDVYLTEVISDSIFGYRDFVRLLDVATKEDSINIHLAGSGGAVDTSVYLINKIKATKATTTAIIEGNNYSGHAFIALSTNKFIFLPNTFLMFHTTSAVDAHCNLIEGMDRSQTITESCQQMIDNSQTLIHNVLEAMPGLTYDEKYLIISGKTLYISGEELNKRLNNAK